MALYRRYAGKAEIVLGALKIRESSIKDSLKIVIFIGVAFNTLIFEINAKNLIFFLTTKQHLHKKTFLFSIRDFGKL